MTHHLGVVHQDDEDLVAAVRAGDEVAFDVLYRRHAARVAGVCCRRVPTSEVDDAVQEAFARAFDRLGTLDDGARFGPWVRTIAVRVCADLMRRRPQDVAVDLVGRADETRVGPDEVVIDRAEAHDVAVGLAALGDRDRRALWLRDALGTSVSEIARDMGTTEGSTRVMLTRARKRLRAAIVAALGWIAGAGLVRRQRLAALSDAMPASVSLTTAQVALAVTAALVAPQAGDIPDGIPAPTMTVAASPASGGAGETITAASPEAAPPVLTVPTASPTSPASDAPSPATTHGSDLLSVRSRPAADRPDDDVVVAAEDDQGERADLGLFLGDVVDHVLDPGDDGDDDAGENREGGDGDGSNGPSRGQDLCLLDCP